MLGTIFVFSFVKALRLKSTWIILFFSCMFMFLIMGVLPYLQSLRNLGYAGVSVNNNQIGNLRIILIYSVIGAPLLILIAVFAGFRGATVFRDEIEDGSFLIMLSKPYTRGILIIAKWLAYLALLIIFSLILAISHNLGFVAGSQFKMAAKTIGIGIGIEFAIGIIFSLIYGSIALLLSAFLSATQTAISTLVFGVIPTLSNMLQPLITSPRYDSNLLSGPISGFFKYQTIDKDIPEGQPFHIVGESDSEFLKRLSDDFSKIGTLPPEELIFKLNFIEDFIDIMQKLNIISLSSNAKSAFFKNPKNFINTTTFQNILAQISFFLTSWTYTDTKKEDPFKNFIFFAFGQQASSLSSFITSAIYGDAKLNIFVNGINGMLLDQRWRQVKQAEVKEEDMQDIFDDLYVISPPDPNIKQEEITSDECGKKPSNEQFSCQRKKDITILFNYFKQKKLTNLYTVKYTPFINRYTVLIVYITLAFIITPLVLFIMKYKNIK